MRYCEGFHNYILCQNVVLPTKLFKSKEMAIFFAMEGALKDQYVEVFILKTEIKLPL